ncbi:MAG TPA: contractile injection system tape measure protein, partial [Bacteroidia bacterium]|nr:contractile injection system tape measure protein [Bacteroidia bacterium]
MKAPDQPHFIQRFKFDFEIDSIDDDHRLHTDLSRIFNSRIKAILDEVMSDLDDPSHIIRIPELVIDLGEIYEGSMEKEVVMRFETVFRRELTLRLGELRHGRAAISSDKGQKVSIVPARLEIVAYFLVNGRLPAGAEQMAGKVEQLILELLETNPPNVVRMLKTVARKPAALKRLSSSFSEKLIGKVYAAIVSENAMSIASIEKKLIADAAKVLKTPQAVLTMEVRQAVLRYLLVDPPAIFDRRKFQAAVTLDVQKVFGKEATTAFGDLDERQEAFASQNEQRARRQAALEVLERYIKGSVPAESPLAIAEAWEYLVKNEAPSLRKMLAAKSVKIAAITSLVQVLSPSAMRDFVEKIVPSSPMQLIHVAASVVSAYSLHRKGAAAEKQFAAEVYAVLVQQLALNPSVTPTASQLAAAIKAHLGRLPDAPKQLLKEWNKLELPGVTTPESRRKLKAE